MFGSAYHSLAPQTQPGLLRSFMVLSIQIDLKKSDRMEGQTTSTAGVLAELLKEIL